MNENMIMNLNILAATIRSFKMLIDYTLYLTPPSPLAPNPSLKRKRRRKNCFKIPTCTVPKSSLQKTKANSSVCTWEQTSSPLVGICWLLAFQTYFCFHPPPPPPMLLLKSSHRPKLTECEPCFATSKES